MWTVAFETYFAEFAKNCDQQSFAPVNQSLFLRLLQMVFKTKVWTMLEEVVVIVWVEERLDSISTVGDSVGNVLCGIRIKLWTTVFCTSKSIVISEASTNGIITKVSTMLEEDDVIVWVEERLDYISTLDGSVGNVLSGIRKKLWTTVFCTSKSIVISEAFTNGI